MPKYTCCLWTFPIGSLLLVCLTCLQKGHCQQWLSNAVSENAQQLLWGIYFYDEFLHNGRKQFSWGMVFCMQENKYQIDLRAVPSSIYIGSFSSISWIRVVSNVIRPSQIISSLPFLYQKCFVPVSQQQIHFFFTLFLWLYFRQSLQHCSCPLWVHLNLCSNVENIMG